MAEIRRLSMLNPSAETATVAYTSSTYMLCSLIITNTTPETSEVTAYISTSTSTPSQYGYLCKDLPLSGFNTFETFRFALNIGDSLTVESSTGSVSFILNGYDQLG